jgi:hypothetical protein
MEKVNDSNQERVADPVADVIEAALARGTARVTDAALSIEGQAAAGLRNLARWAEHVPAARHAEMAALIDACAEEMREPIRRRDRDGMLRVVQETRYKIAALSGPVIEPPEREVHEKAMQQTWGHGGKFNAAFEVGIVFDRVMKPGERIVGYDHRSVTLVDNAGIERVVSRDTVREFGRPGWAYTSQAWHEHNYQAQFTPIEPPPAEPETVGRIGFEFVQGNGFGPVMRRGERG